MQASRCNSCAKPVGHTACTFKDAPKRDRIRISVKREAPAGQVSNWLHDHVRLGAILQVSHPFGEFTPDTESAGPIVLLSAGIGITPMIAALNRIAAVHPERHVIFAHAARDEAHHAHRTDLEAAKAVMPDLQFVIFYETPRVASTLDWKIRTGLMTVAKLPEWPASETDVYLFGPLGFMRGQWRALIAAGVPAARLHREVFGPEMLDYLN
jgi:nitric oxide dioxygenase